MMPKNYKSRLETLRDRRLGPQVYGVKESYGYQTATVSARKTEAYENRRGPEAVKYALGAMEAVDDEYVKNTYAEGARVTSQLKAGLNAAGIGVEFEYQGSVPMNIQIKGISDLDILALHGDCLTYDRFGIGANSYEALRPGKTVLSHMVELRMTSETVLKRSYPAVTVETEHPKAIHMSGGSLRREIDIVPSHWHDTMEYQRTGRIPEREVHVFHKHDLSTIANKPFLFRLRIDNKDEESGGGAKKAIRLLKNVRTDATPEIRMSSYDIASLVFHLNSHEMNVGRFREITLVSVVRDHLFLLLSNEQYTKSLDTPDGSRKIIDTEEKFDALRRLAVEVDEVASDIASELRPFVHDEVAKRRALRETLIY